MPRQIFKNRIIAAAGPLPGQLTTDNLKHWTKLRKGRFSEDFDEDVTHLLCTRQQFRDKVPRVRDALKRGKRFHIVHCDWYEFSTVQEKRQPEREYSMRNILAKQNAARREETKAEKGRRDGEKFVNTNYFHVYHDREFFPYQVDVTRDNEATGELGQRYTLCLWESDAKPHLYWFTAKFLKRKGNSQPSYHRPSSCSGKWREEMDLFMEFFRIKTGIEWEDRVLKEKTMPDSYFQYSPPRGGKPVGRRLRFEYEHCLEVNAKLRGLPWPPVKEDNAIMNGEDAEPQNAATPEEDGDDANVASGSAEKLEDQSSMQDGNVDSQMEFGTVDISGCDDSSIDSEFCSQVSWGRAVASTPSSSMAEDVESPPEQSTHDAGETCLPGGTSSMDIDVAKVDATSGLQTIVEHSLLRD